MEKLIVLYDALGKPAQVVECPTVEQGLVWIAKDDPDCEVYLVTRRLTDDPTLIVARTEARQRRLAAEQKATLSRKIEQLASLRSARETLAEAGSRYDVAVATLEAEIAALESSK